jgi:hypothetical protein
VIGVAFQSQRNQAVNQFRKDIPAASHNLAYMLRLVKPGMVLTSLTKTTSFLLIEQEIHPVPYGAVKACRSRWPVCGSLPACFPEAGGDDQFRPRVIIFCVIGVEITRGTDFAREGGDGLVVAQHAYFDLTRFFQATFHQYAAIEAGSFQQALKQV